MEDNDRSIGSMERRLEVFEIAERVRSKASQDERWAWLKRGASSSFRLEFEGCEPDFSGKLKVMDRRHGREMKIQVQLPIFAEDAFLLVLNEEGWSGYDWFLVHRTGEPIASCEDGYCTAAQALNNAFKRIGEDSL